MKCPHCEELLVISERQGIEIDYCPKCRGVWLDRGELDKIIERSEAFSAKNHSGNTRENFDDDDDFDNRRYTDGSQPRRRKGGGFLGNLFDFD